MFSVEYKLGVSQGGSVICLISSLTMSAFFNRNKLLLHICIIPEAPSAGVPQRATARDRPRARL